MPRVGLVKAAVYYYCCWGQRCPRLGLVSWPLLIEWMDGQMDRGKLSKQLLELVPVVPDKEMQTCRCVAVCLEVLEYMYYSS